MNESNIDKHSKWETIIGLEIHAQIKSNSKLFSSSSTKFGSQPNSQVSLVDAAMPGMLPVINKFCINQAIKAGIGLKAKINNFSSVAGAETARRRRKRILTVPSRNAIFDAHALSWRAAPISPYRRDFRCS